MWRSHYVVNLEALLLVDLWKNRYNQWDWMSYFKSALFKLTQSLLIFFFLRATRRRLSQLRSASVLPFCTKHQGRRIVYIDDRVDKLKSVSARGKESRRIESRVSVKRILHTRKLIHCERKIDVVMTTIKRIWRCKKEKVKREEKRSLRVVWWAMLLLFSFSIRTETLQVSLNYIRFDKEDINVSTIFSNAFGTTLTESIKKRK